MNRIKPDVPKSAHEALAADQQQAGLTVNRMAADYDRGKTWAYDVLNGEMPFAIHHIERWAQLTGAKNIMLWMGRVTGHLVAPIPEVDSDGVDLPALLREFADVVESVTAALADGRISQAEADKVWAEGEQLIAACYSVMHSFRARARRLSFRPTTMAEAEVAAPRAKGNGGAA